MRLNKALAADVVRREGTPPPPPALLAAAPTRGLAHSGHGGGTVCLQEVGGPGEPLERPLGPCSGVACSSSAGTDQSDCSWIDFSNFHE